MSSIIGNQQEEAAEDMRRLVAEDMRWMAAE
jgi:hypothetical protein